MNYIDFTIVVIISLSLFYIGFRLFAAIHFNYYRASELRHQYAQRIRLLPTYKMLRLRGIDLNRLLHGLPVTEIEAAIRNCEACTSTKECQTKLKEKDIEDFDFCKNDPLFTKMKKESR